MKRFIVAALALTLLAVGCAQQTNDGSLPTDQAEGPINAVKAFPLADGTPLADRVSMALASLQRKGMKVIENGWRAYPGPADCPNCVAVHLVVTIGNEAEKYEFLLKQDGKTVEGLNDGAKVILSAPVRNAEAAPPATGDAAAPLAEGAAPPAEGAPAGETAADAKPADGAAAPPAEGAPADAKPADAKAEAPAAEAPAAK